MSDLPTLGDYNGNFVHPRLAIGAGRSVSSDDPWPLRVMAHTMIVGQAAGVAAAVAAGTGAAPREVSIAAVQAGLRQQGVTTL